MKIYTAILVDRWGGACVLYCGPYKESAENILHEDREDEPSPDKDEAAHWKLLEDEFPDWRGNHDPR